MSDADWLLHQDSEVRPLHVGTRTEFDNEFWYATIERIEIDAGLKVLLTDAEVRNGLTVQPRGAETGPWLRSNIAIAGAVRVEMSDGSKTAVSADCAILFRPSGRDPLYVVRPRQRLTLAGYSLRADRLERIFDGSVPPMLRALLEHDADESRVVSMRATRTLRNLGEALFVPGLNGPLRNLYLEGTVLQLLANQTAAGEPKCAAPELSARELRSVHEARERLLADMRSPPSLGELAAAVGLTEKRLNLGFRREFGATAYEVLRNERLAHARLALAEGDLPLKEIAYRVGYNHVTNFINAFTARYGASPGKYAGLVRGERAFTRRPAAQSLS